MSASDHQPLSPADLAAAEARAVAAEARASAAEAMIAQLRVLIEKLRRELYGRRSERKASLIEQLALELEELQASATEDELRAEAPSGAADRQQVQGFTRRKPARKPFPDQASSRATAR
jgi:transposase